MFYTLPTDMWDINRYTQVYPLFFTANKNLRVLPFIIHIYFFLSFEVIKKTRGSWIYICMCLCIFHIMCFNRSSKIKHTNFQFMMLTLLNFTLNFYGDDYPTHIHSHSLRQTVVCCRCYCDRCCWCWHKPLKLFTKVWPNRNQLKYHTKYFRYHKV